MSAGPTTASDHKFGFLFRALRHRNYRLFFTGHGISLIGTWMQGAAVGWLIRDLAEKEGVSAEFWLGMVPFIGQLPTFFLPLLTGVLADRWSRRRILIGTQVLAMVQAICLAIVAASGYAQIWHVMVLAACIGLINSFDIPARQSFVVDLVDDRRDLGNAIALNSSLVNSARLIGPLIAGTLIAYISTTSCFILNAVSYLAVLAALLAMTLPPRTAAKTKQHVLHGLKEGFLYATSSRPIRTVLMLLALISFMGVSYGVLMPVVARDVLKGDSLTFGMLLSSAGAGALCGAGFLASRRTVRGIKTNIAVAAAIFGGGLMAFSFSRSLWLSLPLMMVTGFGMMVTTASSNTFLQAIVDDDKRGRVMSFWTMSFMGMVPFGSLFTGSMAHYLGEGLPPGAGAMKTLLIGGAACVVAAILFATRLPMLRRETHPIYLRKGLIPQVTMAAGNSAPTTSGEEPAGMTNPAQGDIAAAARSPLSGEDLQKPADAGENCPDRK